jgi:FkbM family methyltransferase
MEKIINNIFFILYLFFNPRLWFLIFKKVYLPVYVQFEWLKEYKINTVIDVGSSVGNVSFALSKIFPSAVIYAFDPIKENCESFKKKKGNSKIQINNFALSNKKERVKFITAKYNPVSSMLSLRKEYQKIYPIKNIRMVNTTTLDLFFQSRSLKNLVFLKIDTQGTEKQILEGASKLLKRVAIIHIESSFEPIYFGQSKFGEIYDILTKAGFEYSGSVAESIFIPDFTHKKQENSIFINPNLLSKFLKK